MNKALKGRNIRITRITDWQIRQAIDAVTIYKHQFRKDVDRVRF